MNDITQEDEGKVEQHCINLDNISKMYRIYNGPQHKIKEAFLRGIFRRNCKYHREFWALRDIDLTIQKGETLAIVGQNGSGKSTLLQIIAGVLQPTAGSLEVNGRISALLELGAGFNREFTGRENVFLNGAILGLSRREMEDRFADIVAFADIGEFIDQPVKTYSSGMFIRLAFATAVQVNPDILIIDEALAVGDINFQNRCFRKMEEFNKNGKTILFVTHDLNTIRNFCTKAILLDEGRVLGAGATNDIVNAYNKLVALKDEQYVRRVLGSKDKNITDTTIITPIPGETDMEFRYGMGDAEIIHYKLLDENGIAADILETGKVFTIRSTACFYKDVEEPVMGMIIKTLTGIEIGVTSTYHMEKPIGPVCAGTIVTIEFTQRNILNPGKYTMSVGVSEKMGGGFRPLDRRVDLVTFEVLGKVKSYGIVDMDTEMRIVEKRTNSEIGTKQKSNR